MVGQTEAALKQHRQTYQKSFAKNLSWPTYKRVGLKHAAYKILTDANNLILGAHILSDQASGLINTIKQAMLNETMVHELYEQTIVSPYPTRESDLSYMLKPLLSDWCLWWKDRLVNAIQKIDNEWVSAMPPQFKFTIFLLPFFMKPAVHRYESVFM